MSHPRYEELESEFAACPACERGDHGNCSNGSTGSACDCGDNCHGPDAKYYFVEYRLHNELRGAATHKAVSGTDQYVDWCVECGQKRMVCCDKGRDLKKGRGIEPHCIKCCVEHEGLEESL